MDKNSKKILDYLIDKGGCSYEVFVGDPLQQLTSFLSTSEEDLMANVKFLNELGYLEITHAPNNQILAFSLTHQGRNYKDFKYEKIKNHLVKSVLVPLLVSLLTAFLTTAIGYMWATCEKNNTASVIPPKVPIIEESMINTVDNPLS